MKNFDTEFKNAILNVAQALRKNASTQRWSLSGPTALSTTEAEQCTQYIQQKSNRLEELANNEMGFSPEQIKNQFDAITTNLRNGFGPGQRCSTSVPTDLVSTVEKVYQSCNASANA